MDISEAIEKLRSQATPAEMLNVFDLNTFVGSTNTSYKKYLHKLPDLIESQDTHESVALAIALLQARREQAILEMRKRGMFRISRYDFGQSACVVIDTLIIAGKKQSLKPEALEYLLSMQALHSLQPHIKPIFDYISCEIERFKKNVLKTTFVVIDRIFLGNWNGGDKSLPGDRPLHYSMEDFAEAFSTIISIFKKRFGITVSDWQRCDSNLLCNSDFYIYLLTAAAQLNSFKQAEVMLDGLPYRARLVGGNVHVFSIDPLFEQTVRLGYVQQERQSHIRTYKYLDEHRSSGLKTPSLQEETKRLFDSGLRHLIKIKEEPVRRLVFAMPNFIEGIIGYEGLFLEEGLSMMRLDVDSFSDDDPLLREVKPGISVRHLLIAQRLFAFIAHVYELALEEIPQGDRESITAQSVINIIPREGIVRSLSLGMPEEIAQEVVTMLSLPANGDLIDIQYFPLIPVSNDIVCSSRVFSASNVVRNICISNNLHKGWSVGCDPMIIKLRSSLLEAGFRVEIEACLPFGKDLDADILAYKDGILLLLECKHIYHPCNVHELRNTLWHIEKAGNQLMNRIPLLSDGENLAKLLESVKWSDVIVEEIRGAIVTSTRVLHGWKENGYPVIQANELINVLLRGFIASPEGDYRFWEDDKLTARDVSRYLDGITIIDDQLSGMSQRMEIHPYGASQLVYETWNINEDKFSDRLANKYKFTARPLDEDAI